MYYIGYADAGCRCRQRCALGNGSKVLALSSHHELGRPNSGKILEGIFPSMGLKNRALWAPIFYPARVGWLAETFGFIVATGAPLPASASCCLFYHLFKFN
jgi:hypothetical protein